MEMEVEVEVADDAWASLLPDLLLDIFRRLESTAVIRCAGACKPWRRAIMGNASSLRPRTDRYNPNLLLGFLQTSYPQGQRMISLTDVDTGHCESISSLIPAASTGGVDLSMSYSILTSRDGFLLLCRNSYPDGLCLCNPMAGDCTFLPVAPFKELCTYVLLTREDELRTVRVLAIAAGTWTYMLCPEEDRLAYQVFSWSDDGTGIWGPVQRCEVNKDLRYIPDGGKMVVSHDAVHWLGKTEDGVDWTVSIDVDNGRAWTTELPRQCQFRNSTPTACALTTSGNGRLSLLKPLPSNHIQVWVLDGVVGRMEWTMQHKIWINKRIHPGVPVCLLSTAAFNHWNVICPRSGLLFIMLPDNPQLRINLHSGTCQPVLGKRGPYHYYPYEMDWSTYISRMKNF